MAKTRPPYPAQFKEEVVQLVCTLDKPVVQVARDLGVLFDSLRHKVRSAFL